MSASPLSKLTIEHLRGSVVPFSLPFEKGKKLSVIYGENGTGKSTICDAFEFVGKGRVGSLENRGLGKTNKYWQSVGKKASDVSVTLETIADDKKSKLTCRATIGGAEVILNPEALRPKVEVLRRKQILELIEAKPGERYSTTAAISPPMFNSPETAMNPTPIFPGFETLVKPFKFAASPYEYKVTALRECPTPENLQLCETPDKATDYWRMHIATHPHFNPDCECLAVLLLNTRRKVKGHQIVSIGTMDTILVHAREVFRLAIVTAASGLIVMHNHPSGESSPSEADIKVTRDLIRAGQLLKIELIDHVIIGNGNRSSLRELGYFYA